MNKNSLIRKISFGAATGIGFVLIVGLMIGCKSDGVNTNTTISAGPIFSQVSAASSGIDFVNEIIESPERSMGNYENFFSGAGVAVGDINNDGLADIFFTSNDASNRLYLNKGGMQFEDITAAAGLSSNKWSGGCSMVDVNNDGYLDIYVNNDGPTNDDELLSNDLFMNNGNLSFSNKARELGVADSGRSVQSVFFDADNDGDLDLFVNNYAFINDGEALSDWYDRIETMDPVKSRKMYLRFYKNNGGKFVDQSKEVGVDRVAFGLGLAARDFNDDGFLDVYVANDFFLPDYFFINDGKGKFTEKSKALLGHTAYFAMGMDAADVNNDLLLDMAVVDMSPSDHFRNKLLMASMDVKKFQFLKETMDFQDQYMVNAFQMGVGYGGYSEVGNLMGVSQTEWSWAVLLADFDNDGYKDYYVTNGMYRDTKNNDWRMEVMDIRDSLGAAYGSEDYFKKLIELKPDPVLNYIFKNDKGEGFKSANEEWGINTKNFSHGAAYADFDNDGDLDIVVNLLMDKAELWENKSTQQGKNFIRFDLRDKGNTATVLNSKISIYYGDQRQRVDHYTLRGFKSSVEPISHFGIGNTAKIDSVVINWIGGGTSIINNPKINTLHTIDKSKSKSLKRKSIQVTDIYFADVTNKIPSFSFTHEENSFDDLKKEILLPHKYSTLGPCIAIGDANGDGVDDFYLGGAKGQAGKLVFQQAAGFVDSEQKVIEGDKGMEDLGAKFFDADSDGDLDLYVASGGGGDVASAILLQDRLYINDGAGQFVKSENLPTMPSSTKEILPIDMDNDGDYDLLVGGRNNPGAYPSKMQSYLLRNDNGKFTDVMTDEMQAALPGMITGISIADVNGDNKIDLMVVGEWSAPKLFTGSGSNFKPVDIKSFANLSGWWQSVVTIDLDRDGDLDFILGNISENNKFHPSESKPLIVYANDFDESGTLDIVLTKKYKGMTVPVRGKECSSEQMPFIDDKFPKYADFANSSIEEILGQENLDNAIQLMVNNFSHVALINNGNMSFTQMKLPFESQWAPIMDMVVDDFTGDKIPDVLVAGNLWDTEPETPAYDAGKGLLLRGNGDGTFKTSARIDQSGLLLNKNVKAIEQINLIGGGKGVLVANNNDRLQLILQIEQ
ncbi:MAG: VCBS repeat-containing protein [Saprospiraceae bacterium]|nr:VCBS repeat-containing protein [Saprospiraceae bacterium]